MSNKDIFFINETLKIASQGKYTVYPNPMVGAILVKNNEIIAKGYHKNPGSPHAEAIAIKNAKGKASGATLYVNLEPCCHFGKTPPCIDLIIKSKIKRVVIGHFDPNPLVNKKSIRLMRKANIDVQCGILKEECIDLNKEFYHHHLTNLPFITVKMGLSLDGKVALSNGDSKWITSSISREDVQHERAKSSIILTTSKTVLADNPRMNIRSASLINKIPKQPDLAVIDLKSRLSDQYKIFKQKKRNIYLFSTSGYKKNFPPNVEIIHNISDKRNPMIDILQELKRRGHYKIFIESGPTMFSNLIKSSLLDELLLYVSPKILGHTAKSITTINSIKKLSEKINFNLHDIIRLGNDIKIRLGK